MDREFYILSFETLFVKIQHLCWQKKQSLLPIIDVAEIHFFVKTSKFSEFLWFFFSPFDTSFVERGCEFSDILDICNFPRVKFPSRCFFTIKQPIFRAHSIALQILFHWKVFDYKKLALKKIIWALRVPRYGTVRSYINFLLLKYQDKQQLAHLKLFYFPISIGGASLKEIIDSYIDI